MEDIQYLEKKIEEINYDLFIHDMKDHWSNEDFEWHKKKEAELKQLKDKLARLKK